MRARQAIHFVNDFVFRLMANIRDLCTHGAAGREFDLVRCKATLTACRFLLTPRPPTNMAGGIPHVGQRRWPGLCDLCRLNRSLFISEMVSAATPVRPSLSEITEKIMPAPLIDYSAPPRAAELPAAPITAPARPASDGAGQRSRAIIPGDDPGDQQPPKSL